VGYNPRYRGKRSYSPLLCLEGNSSYLWDTELRPGNAGTWEGSVELLATCFANVPRDIRELRVRADAGFSFNPVLEILEAQSAQYASGKVISLCQQRHRYQEWIKFLRLIDDATPGRERLVSHRR
jgi:hypothetical protein